MGVSHHGIRELPSWVTIAPRKYFAYDAAMKLTRAFLGTLLALLTLMGIAAPAQAATASPVTTVTVYHQAVVPSLVTGSGIGTVRYFAAPMAVNGVAADGQYFTGTLTTLDIGITGNQEVRASDLNFVFGNSADQLVIGGIAVYPASGATLPEGARVIRPVIGGSGKYAGAVGQAISTNLGSKGWTHVFKIRIPS